MNCCTQTIQPISSEQKQTTETKTKTKKKYCMISSRNQKIVNKIPLHFWSWEQIWNVKICVFKNRKKTNEKKNNSQNERKREREREASDEPIEFLRFLWHKIGWRVCLLVNVFWDCFKHFDIRTGVHFCYCLISLWLVSIRIRVNICQSIKSLI